jgi:hypothetical protein
MSLIKWKNDFKLFHLFKFSVLGDGNCFFHSILLSLSEKYKNEKCEKIRKEMSQELRTKIASKIESEYENLLNGEIKHFSKFVPEFDKEFMVKMLKSNNSIGYGYVQIIMELLKINIFILDEKTKNVYPFIKEEANEMYIYNYSIIIYYFKEHYETVGFVSKSMKIKTIFKSDSKLIQFLKSKYN